MRDRLLDFVLALDATISDRSVEYDWGRAFLSPSLPMVWDANGIVVERPGMSAAEVIAAGEEALADLDFRTIAIRDEAEGARLAEEFAAEPGWEVETDHFMALAGSGIGQVEDVGTLSAARGRGHAQTVISAAIAASRQAGHETTFIVADADDWPRLLYGKLGFEPCGALHVFRRPPTAGISP